MELSSIGVSSSNSGSRQLGLAGCSSKLCILPPTVCCLTAQLSRQSDLTGWASGFKLASIVCRHFSDCVNTLLCMRVCVCVLSYHGLKLTEHVEQFKLDRTFFSLPLTAAPAATTPQISQLFVFVRIVLLLCWGLIRKKLS